MTPRSILDSHKEHKISHFKTPVTVVDLFCGVGGLTHGFKMESFIVAAGLDADSSCQYAYESNNGAKFLSKAIEETTGEEIAEFFPTGHLKILVGCAPCQPFSTYGKLRSQDRWKPLYEFIRLIREVGPDIISMENVPQLQHYPIYREFITALENDYAVTDSIVNCLEYGIPQQRNRLVFFASKFGPISLIPPTHESGSYRTVKETIGHLPAISDGQQHEDDPLHRASKLSEKNIKRIAATSEGGSWKEWSEDLKLDCHKKKTGATYRSVYGRMSWDKPAPTMTTHCYGLGNGRFGHPEQNRAISLREAALFQTFPEDYDFIDPEIGLQVRKIARQIGNAVPVRLGAIIAASIKKHLQQHDG